jgi:hypothetical protein
MYTARELDTDETYSFRKLDALVKRLGGTEWKLDLGSGPLLAPIVQVLAKAYGEHSAWNVVTRVRVPPEAIDAANWEHWGRMS